MPTYGNCRCGAGVSNPTISYICSDCQRQDREWNCQLGELLDYVSELVTDVRDHGEV
jgi:hypothetical protein